MSLPSAFIITLVISLRGSPVAIIDVGIAIRNDAATNKSVLWSHNYSVRCHFQPQIKNVPRTAVLHILTRE